jgi:hypothetical protein
MKLTKRNALSLSAVLAATVLTGGAAIFGLTHAPATQVAAPTAVVQQAPAAPSQHWEEGD